MDPLRVAFDVGPLAAPRTGVGHAVQAMHDALEHVAGIELTDYLVSFRSHPAAGTRRLPVPALLAHRWWAMSDRPRADRSLGRPHVVHGTNYVVPPSRAAQVVSVYDCWFLRHPESARSDVRRAGRILRRAIGRGATAHASSQATADQLADLFPGCAVETIPLAALPVPEPAPRPPLPLLAGRPYIAAIGTLERRKNIPTLVDAFGMIAADHPDVSLVLAGADGDDRGAINTAIDHLAADVARRVVLTGRIDEAARSWLLRNASVLAYPSLDEGFGFPLLDAMQVRVPIVAGDRGSIPEVCGAAGLLSDPTDATTFAAHLAQALADEPTRARLLAAAPAQLARFSWDRCAADLAALYRRVGA